MAATDLGAVRTLVVATRLDDAGVTRGLAEIEAKSQAVEAGMADAGASTAALRNQLFFLAFAGGAALTALTAHFGDFQEEATLAGFAAAESLEGARQSSRQLRNEARALARRFNEMPSEVIELERSISQLGITNDRARRRLAQASLVLDKMGETSAPEAANAMFRLAFATERSIKGAQQVIAKQGPAIASAFLTVAESTAEGVSATTQYLERLQESNLAIGLTRAQLIALSGAFTQVASGGRRAASASSALIRIFSDRLPQNMDLFRRVVGRFDETLSKTRRQRFLEDPEAFAQFASKERFQTLLAIASALKNLGTELRGRGTTRSMEKFGAAIEGLGLSIRDQRTLQALGILVKDLPGLVRQANRELGVGSDRIEGQLALWQRFLEQQGDVNEQIRSLGAELGNFALTAGATAAPAISALTGAFEGLFRVLNDNPALTALMTMGVSLAGAGALIQGTRMLVGFSGAGLGATGLGRVLASTTTARHGPAIAKGLLTAGGGFLGGFAPSLGRLFGGSSLLRGGGALDDVLPFVARRRAGRRAALSALTSGASKTGIVQAFFRGALGGTGARLLGLGTGLTTLVSALSLLGPIAGEAADNLSALVGEGRGTMSAFARLLVTALRIVQTLGAFINRAFHEIQQMAKNPVGAAIVGAALGGLAGSVIPGAGTAAGAVGGAALFGGAAAFSGQTNRGLQALNENIARFNRDAQGLGPRSPGGDEPQPQSSTDLTINFGDRDQAAKTARDAIARSPRTTLPTRSAGGG